MKTGRPDLDARIRDSSVPVDEPRFFLRARDPAAAATVRAYVGFSHHLGAPPAVLEQALQQADRMEAWPVKKSIDADHLSEPDRKQLEYELSRRVHRVSKLPSDALDGEYAPALFLAERKGFNDAAGKTRHARALLDAAIERLGQRDPDLVAIMQLLRDARAGLVEQG